MNLSKFFIDRPIFAGVISVLIFVAGLLALRAMPISEYPEVVPPSVVVRAQYPGANPKVIAETVATPIEEQINGVEGMLYMSSQARTDGLMTLTVVFKLGTDPDKATQLVQNRVAQAEPRLPEDVRRLGVTTVKSSPDLTMVVHLLSPNDRYDMTYLRNYALLNVKDRLTRIDGVVQAPGSNAIAISDNVRATMAELKKNMPEGVDFEVIYDPTQFVRASIEAVVHTLLEAVALVVLVVILFLQTWRASIIPLFAVPVSVIGTFAVMHVFGFSINALSLFGLVLAIGIVVDDAIVVVENVERNIEAGLSPRDASYRAMQEVSGPIIAIALVLIAVFVPLAFITGLTGQFYRQFALTIAISTVISAVNSLTLSPALAALLLKGHDEPKDRLTRVLDIALGWFFRRFNRAFARASDNYSGSVKGVISGKVVVIGMYLALIGVTALLFKSVPDGFVPAQDKQYLI